MKEDLDVIFALFKTTANPPIYLLCTTTAFQAARSGTLQIGSVLN
jgi:hypothetical protein